MKKDIKNDSLRTTDSNSGIQTEGLQALSQVLTYSEPTNTPMSTNYYSSTSVTGNVETRIKLEGPKGTELHPRLYFKYLKSNLTQLEDKVLRQSLDRLAILLKQIDGLDQHALFEHLSKLVAIVVRQQELLACGLGTFLIKEVIEKFRTKVSGRPVDLKKLEEFPRIIPKDIATQIKTIKEKNLFDEYWVLYYDSTPKKKEEIKSTKERIREKDPILFGKFSYQPDIFYYILDWTDEYCDLTLENMVQDIRNFDPDIISIDCVPPITGKLAEQIKLDVMKRHNLLRGSSFSTWKSTAELAANEERARGKKSFWKKLAFWR